MTLPDEFFKDLVKDWLAPTSVLGAALLSVRWWFAVRRLKTVATTDSVVADSVGWMFAHLKTEVERATREAAENRAGIARLTAQNMVQAREISRLKTIIHEHAPHVRLD
jgi:hypothetical protein